MNQLNLQAQLESLTEKQLVELMVSIFKSKSRNGEPLNWALAEFYCENKEAKKWGIHFLATHDPDEYDEKFWTDSDPICQEGKCKSCGFNLSSWAKKIICPICGEKAYAT